VKFPGVYFALGQGRGFSRENSLERRLIPLRLLTIIRASFGQGKPLIDIDRRDRMKALQWVGFQAVAVLVLAIAGLFVHVQIALSLLMGGAIGVTGNSWLAFVAFGPSGTRPAKEILASFYLGGIGKFLIVMILFIVAFRQIAFLREAQNALMMFLAFFISQLVIVLAPRLLKQG